jgi:hypothetical protein
MSLKLKEKIQMSPSFDNLMEEDLGVVVGLDMFTSNIKKDVYKILNSLISFLKIYEENKIP